MATAAGPRRRGGGASAKRRAAWSWSTILGRLGLERVERFERVARRHLVGMKRRQRREDGIYGRVARRRRCRPRRCGKKRQIVEAARRRAILGFKLGENELRARDDRGRQAPPAPPPGARTPIRRALHP